MIGHGGGFIGLSDWHSILLLLLLLSALADIKADRIPNGFIFLGIVIGITGSLVSGRSFLELLVSVLPAFFLMYPLFKTGVLGAGDVKLLIMTAVFLPVREFMSVMAGAFVIGAVFSLGKLIVERNGRERFQYFFSYLCDVRRTGHWKIYGEDLKQDYHTYCKNKIHFTVPILFSAVCRIGGLF